MYERRKLQNGFTLLEILLAIILFSILISISIPNIRIWLSDYRLKCATQTVYGFLYNSKASAVKRGLRCRLIVDSDICRIYQYKNKKWTKIHYLSLTEYPGISVSANSKPIFYPSGTVSPTTTITLSNKRGYQKKITISISGRIKIK